MKNVKDILEAEIKNLYALEKQSIQALENLHQGAHHKKLSKRIGKMHKHAQKQLKVVHKYLQHKNINPGNVMDSIMVEISENLQDIDNKELSAVVKDVSLWTSLNRLLSYKNACYENAYVLASQLDDKKLKKGLKDCKKQVQKDLDKLHGKTKKKILKAAVS